MILFLFLYNKVLISGVILVRAATSKPTSLESAGMKRMSSLAYCSNKSDVLIPNTSVSDSFCKLASLERITFLKAALFCLITSMDSTSTIWSFSINTFLVIGSMMS